MPRDTAWAMSEENVEFVRETWRIFGEQGIDGVLDYFSEDCTSEDTPQTPDRATYAGREGVRAMWNRFAESWGDVVLQPVEFIDAGEGVVLVTSMRGQGKGSGTPVDALIAFAYEFRADGKIIRQRAFFSRSEALEAAGLSE